MQAIPNPTEDDKATTEILLTAMRGGAEGKVAKGTFLSYLAAITPSMMQGTLFADEIRPSSYSQVLRWHRPPCSVEDFRLAPCPALHGSTPFRQDYYRS